jgi:MFS family permease
MNSSNQQLGLKQNWKQFTLLVLVNAFVGGMVGMERSILPQFGLEIFGLESNKAILSFIVAFGISKALANYFTGKWANTIGRKNLLIIGWLFALPVPFMLIWAPSWNWVIFANILLGINQGLAWSSTVVMKIDLVGEKDRGFAMGLNEFAGYLSVGIFAFLSGWLADAYGVTPYPFYLGIGLSALGLIFSIFLIKDTRGFAKMEGKNSDTPLLSNIFRDTTFRQKNLSSVTQAGVVNNLNDGMLWGLLPIILAKQMFSNADIGFITALYPAVWGIGQLFTGKMADHFSKKKMLFYGMLMQGLAIVFIPFSSQLYHFSIIAFLIGAGTALVYPTFLTVVANNTHPKQRAESVGIFRLWRDLGYAIGAILTGIVADWLGLDTAIIMVALLTITSAVIIKFRMTRQ